jgi:hypothetical protein
MSTLSSISPVTGDVIEFDRQGERVTGLVLLASDGHAIVDLLDDETVFVSRFEELDNVTVFGEFLSIAA